MAERIRCKREMYAAFLRGDFGNIVPHWGTVGEMLQACWASGTRVGVRRTEPGLQFHPDMDPFDAALLALRTMEPGTYMFGQATPDHLLTLNAELMFDERGIYMHYAFEQVTMRAALRDHGKHARGLMAWSILRTRCNDSSFEDLMALLDRYPDHVVELSCFSKSLGTVPGRNTVIWEVRDY